MTGTSPTARFIPDKKLFHLSAGSTTLLLGINERNELQHLYFGGPLWRDDDLVEARSLPPHDGVDPGTTTTPEEYPAWGGLRFFEPCLKAALPDGTRDLTLQYASHTIDGAELTITLHDPGIQIQVALHYRLHPTGILRKHAVVTNHTQETITLESAQSSALPRPPPLPSFLPCRPVGG